MMSNVLIHSEISNKECTTIVNKKWKYRRLKNDIRMMKNQRSDAEENKLNERTEISKIIWQNNENA